METTSKKIGQTIENLVCNHLINQGLKLIVKNFQSKCGEIDLIMRDDKILVFVEVRHRRLNDYGGGAATVDRHKQLKIIKTANFYLQKHKLYDKVLCRFDVVATSGKDGDQIEWIKDAFWAKW